MRGAVYTIFFAIVAVLLCLSSEMPAQTQAESRPVVVRLRIDNEAITPVTAQFIDRAIKRAEEERAQGLLIVLDTPGGLVDSTREIVKSILQSNVPVVVYVAPSGARAASAGLFITLAGHVAAMAPGTNIGAAHPVTIGGLPGSPQPEPRQTKDGEKPPAQSPMEQKIVNDTVAWARSLAELRGRNVDWVTRAVSESLSSSASEAVSNGVVDSIAASEQELLAALDGREVSLAGGPLRMRTAGAEIRLHQMWWGERILAVISNPNVAFLLMIFGFYGILFELYTPGWGVAGVLGVVCLVLAFFGLAILPISYVGLALIGIAMALFLAEAFVTSFGFLTIGGVICMVIGGVMLVDSPAGFMRVSLRIIIPFALATAAVTFFLVSKIIQAKRAPPQMVGGRMVTADAVAVEGFESDGELYRGWVRARGELWRSISSSPVAAGQRLEVQTRDGLTLIVQPAGQKNVLSTEEGKSNQELEDSAKGRRKR
jgi:membrane-bound serine protease (ClpP class)